MASLVNALRFKQLTPVLLLGLVFGLAGCSNEQNGVAGKWATSEKGTFAPAPRTIEFFADGKYLAGDFAVSFDVMADRPRVIPESGDYLVLNDGRIRFSSLTTIAVAKYQLNDNSLTLDFDDFTGTYQRRSEIGQAQPARNTPVANTKESGPPVHLVLHDKTYSQDEGKIVLTFFIRNTRSKWIKTFAASEVLRSTSGNQLFRFQLDPSKLPFMGSGTPFIDGAIMDFQMSIDYGPAQQNDAQLGTLFTIDLKDMENVVEATSQQVTYDDGTSEIYP